MDRDNDDCHDLKGRLEKMAEDAGLRTRSCVGRHPFQVANRLAIEELEAWYFGDWEAVKAAYPKAPETIPEQARYRDPDRIGGGTWEAFENILQRAGYFKAGLRKLEAARAVAAHWRPETNQSHSFQVLYQLLQEMTG